MYLRVNLYPAVLWDQLIRNRDSLVDRNALLNNCIIFHAVDKLLHLEFIGHDICIFFSTQGVYSLRHTQHTIDFSDAEPMEYLSFKIKIV